MSLIDLRYVDVDFRLEAPPGRATGCNPETAEEMASNAPCPRYSETNILIPRSEWIGLSREMEEELRSGVQRVHDQDGVGQCVAEATTGCMEYRMYFSLGKENFVPLSPASLYSRIGTSNNSGAYVSDGAKYSQLEGVLPLEGENYDHTFQDIGWVNPSRLPSGWQATARSFRAEWQRANSVEEIFSACFQTKPVIVGRRGHAIMYFLPKYTQAGWYIGYLNSWSLDWGDRINDNLRGGLGYDTERNMATTGYICENVTIRQEVPLP